MDGNGCARYLDSLDTDAISDPKWIEMASSHVQLQVYPSLRPSYFEPMVRSGFVPAFFGTADSWSLYQSLWIWDCWGWSVRESWGSNPPPISQSLSPSIGYLPEKIYWIHSSWGPSEVWSGDSIDFDCTIHLWGHQVWALPHIKL